MTTAQLIDARFRAEEIRARLAGSHRVDDDTDPEFDKESAK